MFAMMVLFCFPNFNSSKSQQVVAWLDSRLRGNDEIVCFDVLLAYMLAKNTLNLTPIELVAQHIKIAVFTRMQQGDLLCGALYQHFIAKL